MEAEKSWRAQPLQIVASADELEFFSAGPSAQTEHFFECMEGTLSGRNPLSDRTDPWKCRASLAGESCQQCTGILLQLYSGNHRTYGSAKKFPAVYFYRKDRIGRLIGGLTSIEEQKLSVPEMLLLLAAGAGFAQYANVLVAILQNWISSSYGETMTKITSGKSLFMMIFWMGIVAPIAEEMIFRCVGFLSGVGIIFPYWFLL